MRWVRAFLCVSAARSNAEAREDDVMHDRFDEIAKSRPSLPNSRDDFGRVQGFFLGIFDEFFFFGRTAKSTYGRRGAFSHLWTKGGYE